MLPQHPHANDVLARAVVERSARAISAVPYMPPVSPNAPSHVVENHSSAGVGAPPRPTRGPLKPSFGLSGEVVGAARATALADPTLRQRYPLAVLGEEIEVDSPLVGRHQLRNLALAIAAAVELDQQGIAVTARDIERGIRKTSWPGRFQVIAGGPTIVLDVAHNPAGAWALRAALSENFAGRPLLFVFGAMRDKAVAEMAEILFPLADRVIATHAANPRSATPQEIAESAARAGADIALEPAVAAAVERARRQAGPNGVVVITGSIFVVGEALAALA